MLCLLPIGYSDGYPFHAVNTRYALIRGKRWPLAVYMSANHVTVDIMGSDDIENSSEYKVATAVSPFVPRIFMR